MPACIVCKVKSAGIGCKACATCPEPGGNKEMAERLKGRLMQAEFDLYRVREMSVSRHEAILAEEVRSMRAGIEFLTGEEPESFLPVPLTYEAILASAEAEGKSV